MQKSKYKCISFKNQCADNGLIYGESFSELNFGWQDQLYSIPLYTAWCI